MLPVTKVCGVGQSEVSQALFPEMILIFLKPHHSQPVCHVLILHFVAAKQQVIWTLHNK